MNSINPGFIVGKRVYLRDMIEEDTPYIVAWRNDSDINKWMFNQEQLTCEKHLKWFRNKKKNRLDYVICNKTNHEPIGTVNFINIEKDQAEAGKMLGNKDYWGGGYAKEAFTLWLKHGFEHLGFLRIYVKTMKMNTPNIKLNERLGFMVKEERAHLVAGSTHQILVMDLSKKEFLK